MKRIYEAPEIEKNSFMIVEPISYLSDYFADSNDKDKPNTWTPSDNA